MGGAWVGAGSGIRGDFQISSAGQMVLYEMLSHKFYNLICKITMWDIYICYSHFIVGK